ncbi:MAG: protein kinase [Deltaproteobacteria bacterium]|nr:protein kinase [Deltaproteobacteria bacterium]
MPNDHSHSSDSPSEAPEELIGGYRLIRKLGQGGMGEVWIGEHQRLERRAAVKLLLPTWTSDDGALERFFIEAKATSRIRHPGIVEIVDCGVTQTGRAYIVMELLEGKNLRQAVSQGSRADLAFILSVGRQVASAVGAAHVQKIVHRDLKPDNIFLVEDPMQSGVGPRAKVLDFGIAKLVDAEADVRLTGTGILVGTPAYMSPEQARGRGVIDHRTDIYALGCILFEMAAGRPPFLYEGLGEMIAARLTEDPPALSGVVPGVPEAFERLVARMLARDPQARVATMTEVESELDNIAKSGVAFLSSPALAVVGRTAILTPASGVTGPRASTSVPAARTTFTLAAGEVDPVPPRRVHRVLPIALAAALIGVAAFWFMRPRVVDRAPARATATTQPAAPVDPVPVPNVAPPRNEAPAAAQLPPPAPLEPPRQRVPTPSAPKTTAPPQRDLDALVVDPSDPKKPIKRRSKTKDTSARPTDLDALAE